MIKVLVVDDSFFMRTLITNMLSSHPEIQVIGTAKDGNEALNKIKTLKPDVVTLDFLMPGSSGLDTLKRIMTEHPTPVIMLSAYTEEGAVVTVDCLEAGALGFVLKPSGVVSHDIEKVKDKLTEEIKKAAKVDARKIKAILTRKQIKHFVEFGDIKKERVIVIGASTGGPPALEQILSEIPSNFPAAILIVQHMPAKFTKVLAERLSKTSEIPVKEAEEGDIITPSKAYVAPGDFNMTLKKRKAKGKVTVALSLNQDPAVNGMPSVDVTMKSTAEVYGENAIGVILTGMGRDGAEGMKAIKSRKGKTIVQDEATSLIWGMPKQAMREGSADHVLPLFEIAQEIIHLL